jgi:hypothetical protein
MNISAIAVDLVSQRSRRETLLVIALCGAVLAFNLATAERFPVPWVDEIMFADPAVNLLLGNGFTSSAWFGQRKDAFWARK